MSSVLKLGRLEQVDLRQAWANEAANFTPWLAEAENLLLLGETLGLDLEVEAVEKPVDMFSADILAREVSTGGLVLIENQLEQTDHGHLGQILTYAAGLDAQTVVWIARDFRDPHRAALDYLNRITAPEHNFFGVQLELYRIGDSALAPRFTIVAKPNDWSKRLSAHAAENPQLAAAKQEWVTYWSAFQNAAEKAGLAIAAKTPPKEGWCRIEQLRSGEGSAAVWLHNSKPKLRTMIWTQGQQAKHLFAHLLANKEAIEAQVDGMLTWDAMAGRKSCMIYLQADEGQFETQTEEFGWYMTHAKMLGAAVSPFVASFEPFPAAGDPAQRP